MIKELWVSFIDAWIRFWNNRFLEKENPELRALQIELEYARRNYEKLFQAYTELANPSKKEKEEESEARDLKPIKSYVPSWSYRAEQLEKKHKSDRESLTERLEKELGVESSAV